MGQSRTVQCPVNLTGLRNLSQSPCTHFNLECLVLNPLFQQVITSLFFELPIHKDINLLIVETQPSLHHSTLLRRVDIVPNNILNLGIPNPQAVIIRLALVRAERRRLARRQHAPVLDSRGRQVMPRAKPRLVQEHIASALGHYRAVDLDADLARAGQNLDALVGVFGVRA